jgi:hypothetical protein
MRRTSTERRRAPRHCHVDDHGIVSTRVRPGHDATLIDVSAGGAFIETSHRLLPGASVELHVETRTERASISGRVLRCAVFRLRPSWISYRGAIGFDRHLPWWREDGASPVSTADARSGLPEREPITPELI